MVFPVVKLCKLDDKEEKVLKNWCFPTVLLEKTLESLSDGKDMKLVNPKGNNPKYSLTHAEAEAPILWLPDAMSWFIGKDTDAGEDWRQKEKEMTEDQMVVWHQFEQFWEMVMDKEA